MFSVKYLWMIFLIEKCPLQASLGRLGKAWRILPVPAQEVIRGLVTRDQPHLNTAKQLGLDHIARTIKGGPLHLFYYYFYFSSFYFGTVFLLFYRVTTCTRILARSNTLPHHGKHLASCPARPRRQSPTARIWSPCSAHAKVVTRRHEEREIPARHC